MARRVYRVCRAVHRRLDGEGARLAGGRWNSPGKAVVYMAVTVSLAVLENLVHMARADFPAGYILLVAMIPDGLDMLDEVDLRRQLGEAGRQTLGDRWIDSGSSAVLAVRSTVVPFERNFLLNPAHPDFRLIQVEPAVPFTFDERLFGA
jgi:RES domain-containing protein